MEDPFCILPWIHLNLNNNGAVNLCCKTTDLHRLGHVEKSSLEQIWNNSKMKETRQRMLTGKQCASCEDCYAQERAGMKSHRQVMNEQFAESFQKVEFTREDGSLPQFELEYLDIRFSNICNFSCRICRPSASTGWYKDAPFMGMGQMDGDPVSLTDFTNGSWHHLESLIPKLKRVYFVGGEPFMQEEHYKFLDKLIALNKEDTELYYSTNFSMLKYKQKDVLSYWKKFKRVNVGMSLDALGEKGELLRKGQNWNHTEQNLLLARDECPHVQFNLIATISIHNAFAVLELIRDWLKKELVAPLNIHLDPLRLPSYYCIQALPSSLKRMVESEYESFQKEISDGPLAKDLKGIINFMWENDQSSKWPQFKAITQRLDVIRSENFSQTFPEYGDFI